MNLSVDDFNVFHVAVHGKDKNAFEWQDRLLRQIVADRKWPQVLDLPTGVGKTTCIDIALFALALDAQEDSVRRWCPRRIAMVVDRRIVVDQVAERGRKLLRALVAENAEPVVREISHRLRALSKEAEEPLGVFTLRGGIPKDEGWARTPDQPLIIASTVDQLGSRLLIQGYGVSRGMKPVHAGLLGNDVLLLLDEVHLSQPFAETLEALGRLRERFAKVSPLPPRFHHAFLSATPSMVNAKPFGLLDDEKRPESPLGPRLHAPKPARLREVEDRPALEQACTDEARDLIDRHSVIAVVVNRVASVSTVVHQLRDVLGDRVDVVPITGRMRPLDRDEVLRALRRRIMTGRDRANVDKKLVVVGTQCLEAGADFDFDAIVTEAASFDALRQRFGRVDRLGLYGKAEGVIVYDKNNKDDPVYGGTTVKTVTWLEQQLPKRSKKTKDVPQGVDFGVLALPLPPGERLKDMVAPKECAPVLLPAYLDLWIQTSPAPVIVPDVSLWLHGPKSGPADVQVVWRIDLSEDDLVQAFNAKEGDSAKEHPVAIVAAVRPSSLEAISLPFVAAKRWLLGKDIGDVVDVEGVSGEDRERGDGRPVLRWDGDDSAVISAKAIRPGDTIVLPATRGGIRDGCFESGSTDPVVDLAEQASLLARGQPVLRLHPHVLNQLNLSLPVDDLQESRHALETAAEQEEQSWRKLWLERLAKSKNSIVVDADEPWTVLRGKRVRPQMLRARLSIDDTVEDGVEVMTDEDDSFHTGLPVTLSDHSADVERFARDYAEKLLPKELIEDIALAGWLHDVGKADRRFQVLLRGGSEIAFFKDETPWAKSGMPPGAKAAHRLAQRKSKYPNGARHEVQSLAMLEKHLEVVKAKAYDVDLVLHLVASHHGYCRPFAPVVVDDAPVDVMLSNHQSASFGTVEFSATTSKHELHRLDAPLADRFWRLVERYGWLELCWLEAILRLADHRASEKEQEMNDET